MQDWIQQLYRGFGVNVRGRQEAQLDARAPVVSSRDYPQIRARLGLKPMSRAEKLADLQRNCSDMHDAISLEEFADMSDRDLARVVKIGPAKERKHCYSIDSLKPHFRTKMTDPLNPSYVISPNERQVIMSFEN